MAGRDADCGTSHGSALPQDQGHESNGLASERSAQVLRRVQQHVETILAELQAAVGPKKRSTRDSAAFVDDMDVLREKMIRETVEDLENVLD